jgi:hypothetical protein
MHPAPARGVIDVMFGADRGDMGGDALHGNAGRPRCAAWLGKQVL